MIENSIRPIWNKVTQNCIRLIWKPTENFSRPIWLGKIENSIRSILNEVTENCIRPIWKSTENFIFPI